MTVKTGTQPSTKGSMMLKHHKTHASGLLNTYHHG